VLEALREAPTIGESLCGPCREHFERLRSHLDALGVRYRVEPTLVRGLDYYTRTTFEFKDTAGGAAQDTICGGGRYDGLVEELGGEPTPGIGFGAGLDRLVLALEDAGRTAEPPRLDAFLVAEDRAAVLPLLAELRRAGVAADVDYAGRSRNAQLKHAQRLDPHRIVLVEDGEATIRGRGREDERVPLAELPARLTAP
jgi:histidyl-tRNA synthetase